MIWSTYIKSHSCNFFLVHHSLLSVNKNNGINKKKEKKKEDILSRTDPKQIKKGPYTITVL
jgi:hypothetical protein